MITDKDIIKVSIDDVMRETASEEKEKYIKNLKKDPTSMLRGEGAYAGELGKEMLKKVSSNVKLKNKVFIVNGKKILVKTKQRTVDPALYFSCSIKKDQRIKEKDVDYYIFAQVNINKKGKVLDKKGWLLGFKSRKNYFKKATFHKKGSKDPSDPTKKFRFRDDTWNLPIEKLSNISKLLGKFIKEEKMKKKKDTKTSSEFSVTIDKDKLKKPLTFIDQLSKVISAGDNKDTDLVLIKTTKKGISIEYARGGLYAKIKSDATILSKGGFVIPFPYLMSIRGRKKELTLNVEKEGKNNILRFKSGVTKGEIKVSKKYEAVENAIPDNEIKCSTVLNPKLIRDNMNKVVFNTFDPHIDKGIGLPVVIKSNKKTLSMTSNDKFCASKISINSKEKVNDVLITLQASLFDLILRNCDKDVIKIGKDDSSTKFISNGFVVVAPTQDINTVDFDDWVKTNIEEDDLEAEITFDTSSAISIIEDICALPKVADMEPTVFMNFKPDKMKANVLVELPNGKTTSMFKIKKMIKNDKKIKNPVKIKVTGYLLEEFLKIMNKNKTTTLAIYSNLVVIKDSDNNFNYIIPLLS